MAKQAQAIIDEVRNVLNDLDEDHYRWSDDELLDYLNAAGRQIVTLLPEANVTDAQFQVAPGSNIRKTIPTGGVKFIKVNYNYLTATGLRGTAVRYIEQDALDTFDPNWTVEQPADPTVNADHADNWFEHYMHDARDPKAFMLYPAPHPSTTFAVNISYSALPAETTTLGANWSLADEYVNAAIEYMAFRALNKEGRHAVSSERQTMRWENFLRFLGLKPQVEERAHATNPNRPPEGP